MSDNRMVKKWKPVTTRLQGRPKSRWNDNVKQDICKMKIKNWTVCVQDHGKWRDVTEKAKTFNNEAVTSKEEESILEMMSTFA
jgi:hypothetical protein